MWSRTLAEQRQNLAELQRSLGSVLQDRASGALVRARFSMSNEMDAPTSFFFGLERQQGQDGHMNRMRLPDRWVTCEQSEMREGAVIQLVSGKYWRVYRSSPQPKEVNWTPLSPSRS